MKSMEPIEVDGPLRIYVGGLEHLADISENDLRNLFPFGDIDYIDLQKDENTGKIKGYAYIQFRKSSHAKLAIREMNGVSYNGKILKVFKYRLKNNRLGRLLLTILVIMLNSFLLEI